MIDRENRRASRTVPRYMPSLVRLSVVLLLVAVISIPYVRTGRTEMTASPFTNPIQIDPTAAGPFESCADPAIIRGQQPGDDYWYLYCTDNPLNGADRAANGRLNDHFIPMLRSRDLSRWAYVGDAFPTRPSWIARFTGLWAPDIHYFNGQYYLYYTVVGMLPDGRESAIGVATSSTPIGPWTDSGGPVVEPQADPSGEGARRWVFDSAVATDDAGQRFLFYGSFVGGISARRLSADGLHTDPASEVPIASANRYEAVSIVRHEG
jgi:arabinan endo-1,5-alpha-L-arabinosidase